MRTSTNTASLLLMALLAAPAMAIDYQTVIVSGRPDGDSLGPELGPGIDWFDRTPALWYVNEAGQVAFLQELDASVPDESDHGIWRWTAGTKTLVSREGDQVSTLGAGVVIDTFGALDGRPGLGFTLGEDGSVFYSPFLTGTGISSSNNESYILTSADGTSTVPFQENGQAPGFPNGFFNLAPATQSTNPIFQHQISSPHMSSNGELMTSAFFLQGPGVVSSNNALMYAGTPDNLQPIAREGDAAPDVTPGATFGDGLDDFYYTNSGGYQTFLTSVNNPDTTEDSVLYRHNNGDYKAVATEDSPTGISGVNFRFSNPFRLSQVNENGDVSFSARMDAFNDLALFLSPDEGSLQPLAARTLSAPGTGIEFGSNPGTSLGVSHVLNASGDVAFMYNLTGTGVDTTNDRGLWVHDASGTRLALREGDNAVDLEGVTIGTLQRFTFNDNQRMVVISDLVGAGVTSENDRAMWLLNADGGMKLLLRKGDLFDVDPTTGEDLRTIADFELGGYYYYEMLSRYGAFNDNDQLAFSLVFTDGTSGLFMTAVPEPVSMALFAIGLIALLVHRRCKPLS